MLASAYEAIHIIDWNTDAVIMHYKFHEPHPAITNLVINKHGEGKENRICYPGDQFYLPVKNALNLQIRYPERGILSSLIVANIELMTQ